MGHCSKWDGPLALIGVVDGTRQVQVGWALALIGVVDGTRQVQVGWTLALIGVVDVTRQLQVRWAPSTDWSGRWDTTGPSGIGP